MQNITRYQIIASIILASVGFAFRIGTMFYANKMKVPDAKTSFFIAVFSYGASVIAFLLTNDRDWNDNIKGVAVCAAGFFGSEVIPGLGSIKGSFFKELFMDFLRKWVNNKSNGNDYDTKADYSSEENNDIPEQ